MSDGLDPASPALSQLWVRVTPVKGSTRITSYCVSSSTVVRLWYSGNAPTSANRNAIKSAKCMIVSKYSAKPVLCSPMSRWDAVNL